MPIREQRFHGMVPKVDGEALGDGTAQLAKNCDITSGALRPINAVGPFVSMHNADGSLKSTLPVADLVTIPKPSTPTVIRREKICDPTQWLKMIPSRETIVYMLRFPHQEQIPGMLDSNMQVLSLKKVNITPLPLFSKFIKVNCGSISNRKLMDLHIQHMVSRL